MKVLLNEDLDYRLAQRFPTGFDVYFTQWMGWPGISNGALRPQTDSMFWLRQTGA